MIKYYLFLLFILLGCRQELEISEFSFNFSSYVPALRIEALILPHDSTAIVRIDKSFLINDTELYDCRDNDFGYISEDSCHTIDGAFWHGDENETSADCGDWNPFIHDLGSDGKESIDDNSDGDYRDFGDIAPDKDGTENNGIPDCGEPNVDGYTEILPSIHDSTCTVSMIKTNLDGVEDTCNFFFEDAAGYFFNNIYTGDRSNPIFDNIETVTYGAYIPSFNCGEEYWTDYSAEYSFYANCSTSEFGIIESEEPITISKPVVFISENDVEDIKSCSDYDCLLSSTSINFQEDSVYFGRYSSNQKIRWASILPDVTFQVVQYLFDRANNEYKYYHGHAGFSPPEFQFNDVAISEETIVTEFYDGEGNGQWDDDEIYADENENGQWDEEEYFIDTGDTIPEVDTYYYEIFTFSDSYRNYYFNDQLYLDDPERTNLRDEESNPVMGAFGSMTSEKIYFRIIDCTVYGPSDCESADITKSVCEWNENISLQPCVDYEGPICLPVNFSTEFCE